MAKIKKKTVDYYSFYCPGCKQEHVYSVFNDGSGWQFNGDMENPTFTPSLLNRIPFMNKKTGLMEEKERCHLYITNGKIEYCSDCYHELAGQSIELKEE